MISKYSPGKATLAAVMLATAQLQTSYTGHAASIYALSKGPEGFFFAGDGAGLVTQGNYLLYGDLKGVLQAPSPIYSLAYLAHRHELLAGQADGSIQWLSLTDSKLILTNRSHTRGVFALVALPSGIGYAAAGGDGALSLWGYGTPALKARLELANAPLRCLAVHPAGHQLAVGASDGQIRVLSLPELELIYSWPAHAPSVFTLAYNHSGSMLVSAGRDASICSWQAMAGYHLHQQVAAHLFTIHALAYSPDNSYLVSASMDKTFKIWDATTLRLLKVVDRARGGHTHSVNTLLWPEDSLLLTASDDRIIRQWHVALEA